MDSYRVTFKRSVEKELRRIDKSEVKRILNSVQDLSENPFPPSSRKLVGSDHTHRLRVGDYRVVYFVLEDENEIQVQRIRHRKDVYR